MLQEKGSQERSWSRGETCSNLCLMGSCPGQAEIRRRGLSPAQPGPATYLFPGSLVGAGTGGAFALGPATCFRGQNQSCEPWSP